MATTNPTSCGGIVAEKNKNPVIRTTSSSTSSNSSTTRRPGDARPGDAGATSSTKRSRSSNTMHHNHDRQHEKTPAQDQQQVPGVSSSSFCAAATGRLPHGARAVVNPSTTTSSNIEKKNRQRVRNRILARKRRKSLQLSNAKINAQINKLKIANQELRNKNENLIQELVSLGVEEKAVMTRIVPASTPNNVTSTILAVTRGTASGASEQQQGAYHATSNTILPRDNHKSNTSTFVGVPSNRDQRQHCHMLSSPHGVAAKRNIIVDPRQEWNVGGRSSWSPSSSSLIPYKLGRHTALIHSALPPQLLWRHQQNQHMHQHSQQEYPHMHQNPDPRYH